MTKLVRVLVDIEVTDEPVPPENDPQAYARAFKEALGDFGFTRHRLEAGHGKRFLGSYRMGATRTLSIKP